MSRALRDLDDKLGGRQVDHAAIYLARSSGDQAFTILHYLVVWTDGSSILFDFYVDIT